ncbi:exo-alpha-sialidase [candidate division WOR-3 bacterium]|uniref:Exo-alpha-sialidase n=1 Tax=candidate division WOR-3 bacterium TaxID=2052148 RepID=A0A937XAS7_UNCW3|nr:exo-alpha-sialidase [candidate division WOR-3 bacterium]
MKYFALLVPLLLVTAAFADQPWGANVRAADVGDTINEGESCIASDGDYVYCVCNWAERSRYAGLTYGRSTNGGTTWTSSVWKDTSVGIDWHTDPLIMVDDSHYVHLYCQFSTTVLNHYLSTDHGVTWSDTSDVSEFLPSGTVDKPWGVVRGNNIYIAWQQWDAPQQGIVFAKSTDRGRTWNRTVADSTRTGITGICLSPSGIIYLMNRYWGGDGVYCTRSTDQGTTWAPWVTVDPTCSYTDGYGDRAPLPSIAAPTDSNVVITWVDDGLGNWDIVYSRSTDSGQTWSATTRLPDSSAGGQCKGWVTADYTGRLHFMWYHTPSWPTSSSSRWSMRYTYSDDYGATIRSSIRITDTTFTSPVSFLGEYHIIVTDSTYARAIWADGRGGDNDLFFAEAALTDLGLQENPWQVTRLPELSLELPAIAHGSALAVSFAVLRPRRLTLAVLDATGRILKTVDMGKREAGTTESTKCLTA